MPTWSGDRFAARKHRQAGRGRALTRLGRAVLPPFYVTTEKTVEITAPADDSADAHILRGRLDVLVLKDRLWVLVIEAKRAEFSLKVGIPQVLGDMVAAPNSPLPLYGLVTNGSSFWQGGTMPALRS